MAADKGGSHPALSQPRQVSTPHQGNALKSLLDRAVVHEKAGAVIPHDLLQFGLYGSCVVIATGLLALLLPDAVSIGSSSFYLVLGSTAASLTTLMKTIAVPAIVFGSCLLVLDLFLMRVRTSARWRSAIVVQAVMGGAGGAICTLFLALVVVNLALWILIFALILAVIGVALSAMGS